MRKTLLAAMLLLLSLGAIAQEGESNIGFNMAFASPILRERGSASSTKLSDVTTLYGLKAGFVFETTVVKGFGVQLGVNYTFGAKSGTWTTDGSSTIHKTRHSYLYSQVEIPVDWQYKFAIAKETYLILYTGPTLQCGISLNDRKYDQNVDVMTGKTETTITKTQHYRLDSDADGVRDYNRVNITWGIGAGFQYKQYFLRGGYDFGILNPYHDRFYNTSTTDSSLGWYRKGRFDQWSIKLGIYFWQFKDN